MATFFDILNSLGSFKGGEKIMWDDHVIWTYNADDSNFEIEGTNHKRCIPDRIFESGWQLVSKYSYDLTAGEAVMSMWGHKAGAVKVEHSTGMRFMVGPSNWGVHIRPVDPHQRHPSFENPMDCFQCDTKCFRIVKNDL